jgi:cholesterol oxidase
LRRVRSAVASQIGAHMRVGTMTGIKAGLHLPQVLDALGVKSMTAYVDTHADWKARLFDDLLRFQPIGSRQTCHSDVCRRITFLYSLLYQHQQLNEATHAALHELFGVANIASLEHLTALVRHGSLVSATGEDVYMPHLDRLAIPLAFIHGAQNQCWLPESTALTYEALCAANGSALYTRYLVPRYGHIDCIFGKQAATDVYPRIVAHLDATQ